MNAILDSRYWCLGGGLPATAGPDGCAECARCHARFKVTAKGNLWQHSARHYDYYLRGGR